MKHAFTLIELLVVIAIIAILAAILFPVFARAKDAAKKTVCISNFKQLATATAMYVADCDEQYMNATDGFAGAGQEGGWMYYSVFGNDKTGTFDPSKGALFPYVKSAGVFVCPTDRNSNTAKDSYAINACLEVHPLKNGINPGRATSAIEFESDTMMFGEEGVSDDGTNDAFFNPRSDMFTSRHAGKSNVVFADSHAKTIDAQGRFVSVVFGGKANCD